VSKTIFWTGRVITWLAGIFLLTSGVNVLFVHSPDLVEAFTRFGYPPNAITPIGLSALLGSILYLIPKTEVLGAIVLTGYLGGAVATHVRINDPTFFAPLILGILIWLGIYLRDDKLRTLIPVRR
jgi:hypothetical protein